MTQASNHRSNVLDSGLKSGLIAVCSAHFLVIETALDQAAATGLPIAIEATANQVNQSGGYTGLSPQQFIERVLECARKVNLPRDRLIVGMDHLGPHTWPDVSRETAWQETAELVHLCVKAGYDKLHLDTVTGHDGGRQEYEDVLQAAVQTADLCRIAEKTALETAWPKPPLYVIGTDVPVPGGGMQPDGSPVITTPRDLEQTLTVFEKTFRSKGLDAAWRRTTAIVVQPGVDFGDYQVAAYCHEKATELAECRALLPHWMTFEVHAADYQPRQSLRELINDGFNLLKIGPCLTFSLRQTMYALAHIEEVLPRKKNQSNLRETMEAIMIRHPENWRRHYHGGLNELHYLRHFSYKDRIRYYWNRPSVRQAVRQLSENLQAPVPKALIEQYLPDLTELLPEPHNEIDLERIVKHRIDQTLSPYLRACRNT